MKDARGEMFRTRAVFPARTAIEPMAATSELLGYTFSKNALIR